MISNGKHDTGILILRLAVGCFMLTHGVPKLMSLFGDGPIQFADPIGVGVMASMILAVFAEFLCSIFIIVGFKTRLAAIPLAATMFVAGFIVHSADAWNVKERAFIYLAIYVSLIITGGGKFSVSKK